MNKLEIKAYYYHLLIEKHKLMCLIFDYCGNHIKKIDFDSQKHVLIEDAIDDLYKKAKDYLGLLFADDVIKICLFEDVIVSNNKILNKIKRVLFNKNDFFAKANIDGKLRIVVNKDAEEFLFKNYLANNPLVSVPWDISKEINELEKNLNI
ncbi:hypothetical protein R4B61_07580 (plasmid) [Fructilactobacillus vespulae]|uniref:hypothetical protein n=1 Tax=Fructilactobacillus vespulae TaxID=1249630 RepID=UPI0039B40CEC